MTDKPDKLKTMIEEEFYKYGKQYNWSIKHYVEVSKYKLEKLIYQIAKKWGEEKVKKENSRIRYLLKIQGLNPTLNERKLRPF